MEGKILFTTARSFVVELVDADVDYRAESYDIYIDGVRKLTTEKTIETVYGLKPDTDYVVQLARGDDFSEEIKVHTEY